MADESLEPNNGQSLSENQSWQAFLNNWIENADPDLVEVARFAALPHSFDLNLMAALQGDHQDLPDLVMRLQSTQIVKAVDNNGRYAVQPALRDLFVQDWQQESNRSAYQQASALAAEFYRLRLSNPVPSKEWLQVWA